MNGKDIFLGLKYVGEDLIEEAEYGHFSSSAAKNAGQAEKRKPLRRPLLIAAIIAATLLLVGCAVVYALSIENLKVGEWEQSLPTYNEYMEFQGYETIIHQELTLAGLKGSSDYQAAQEWFAFRESYDPDYTIWQSVKEDPLEYPMEYAAYDPYTPEMVDKIDEISGKYNLQLMGAPLALHSGRRFYQEMGIDSLLVSDNSAQISLEHAMGYESGAFYISLFYMDMPAENGQWPYRMTNSLYFCKKGCFNIFTASIGESGWTEWNYTTASGHNVLLVRNGGIGWIICDREDSTIAIRVEISREEGFNVDGRSWFETVYMTDRQFELVADAFDFSIQPQYQGAVTSFEGVDPKNMVQTQNGYTMELKSAVSDGQMACITLGITAPEGVSLTKVTAAGFEEETLRLEFGNDFWELLTPKSLEETSAGGSGTWYTVDDGDGLDHTIDLVIERNRSCSDGLAFPENSVWTLYFEYLRATYWNSDKNQDETLWEVEGNWMFELTFEGDSRELEMAQAPVTTNVVTGWTSKGEDVYSDVTIQSFVLRSLSAAVTFEDDAGELTDYKNEKYVTVVMKDGSSVRLHEDAQLGNTVLFRLESPIDLDQVDYILLVDGTKLPAPEAAE